MTNLPPLLFEMTNLPPFLFKMTNLPPLLIIMTDPEFCVLTTHYNCLQNLFRYKGLIITIEYFL